MDLFFFWDTLWDRKKKRSGDAFWFALNCIKPYCLYFTVLKDNSYLSRIPL